MSADLPVLLRARVSILARVVPALSYALPALGAAISGWSLIKVFRGMRNAETSGMAAVTGRIGESNIAIVVVLYLAIIVGVVAVVIGLVRMFTTTTTASPSGWYFLITGIMGLIPTFLLWQAQSIVLDVIYSRTTGMVNVARQVVFLCVAAIASGILVIPILLISAGIPLPSILRAKRPWAPMIMLLIMETAIIAMTILYHARTAWLYSESGRY